VVAIAVGTLLTGCTAHAKKQQPTASAFASALTSAPVSPAASAPASAVAAVLPAGCAQLLSLQAVEQSLGVALLGGVTYLRAAAVPQSGRTGRVTCGYGTPMVTPSASPGSSAQPTPTPRGSPLVQASYITYVDATTAKDRVALTVQTDGASSTVTKVDVNGNPAAVLTGPQWSELLMSDGARTIVVVAQPSILPAPKATAALIAMAKVMLSFGAPAASQAVSPSAAAS